MYVLKLCYRHPTAQVRIETTVDTQIVTALITIFFNFNFNYSSITANKFPNKTVYQSTPRAFLFTFKLLVARQLFDVMPFYKLSFCFFFPFGVIWYDKFISNLLLIHLYYDCKFVIVIIHSNPLSLKPDSLTYKNYNSSRIF